MYILVTPAKNEEDNLLEVIKQVLNQDLRPKLWVIVDDNSDDGTAQIIEKYSDEYQWIELFSLKRKDNKYDTEFGYSKVVKEGMKSARKIAEKRNIDYKYIGILDADILVEKNYFRKLVQIAKKIGKVGIISGLLHLENKNDSKDGHPRGGARLYHRKCLDEIDGYPITAAPDTVTNIKAQNRGWTLIKTPETFGKQLRPPRAGKGLWEGYKMKAKGRYYLNYHPINALLASFYLSLKYPFYIGLAFFYGYFYSYLMNKPQTDDKEIIKHFYYDRFNGLKNRLG